mgnify:CR=1 FL=1
MASNNINWDYLTSLAVPRTNQYFSVATNNDNYLHRLLPRLPVSEAGKSVFWLQTGSSTAKGFREGNAFKNPDHMTPTKGELRIGYFHQVMRITGEAQDRMMMMGGDQIGGQFHRNMQDSFDSLIRVAEAALYLGDDTDSYLVGLGSAIEDGNNYAGIDRSAVANARSYVNDNSGTPRSLSTTLLNATHKGIVHTNRGFYDTIITSPTQGDNLRGLTADVHKLGGQVFVQPGEPMQLSIGIGTVLSSGLRIKGAPVIEIPGYPTDRIDYLALTRGRIGIEVHRPVRIEGPFTSEQSDDIHWKITYGITLVNRNPRMDSGRLGDLS